MTSHAKKAFLVFALQAIAITAAVCLDHTPLDRLAMAGLFAAFLVPFPGYIIALYRAPMGFVQSSNGRMAVLTLLSFFLTVFGGGLITVALLIAGAPTGR